MRLTLVHQTFGWVASSKGQSSEKEWPVWTSTWRFATSNEICEKCDRTRLKKKNELNEQANENTVESDGFIESLAVEGGDGAGVGAAERRRDAADVGRVIGDRIRCKADDL